MAGARQESEHAAGRPAECPTWLVWRGFSLHFVQRQQILCRTT